MIALDRFQERLAEVLAKANLEDRERIKKRVPIALALSQLVTPVYIKALN